jgi:hypothetical protein
MHMLLGGRELASTGHVWATSQNQPQQQQQLLLLLLLLQLVLRWLTLSSLCACISCVHVSLSAVAAAARLAPAQWSPNPYSVRLDFSAMQGPAKTKTPLISSHGFNS